MEYRQILKGVVGVVAAVALGYIEGWQRGATFSPSLCKDIKDLIKSKGGKIGYMEDQKQTIDLLRQCSTKIDPSIGMEAFICKKHSADTAANCKPGNLEVVCQALDMYYDTFFDIDKCLEHSAEMQANCMLYMCHS